MKDLKNSGFNRIFSWRIFDARLAQERNEDYFGMLTCAIGASEVTQMQNVAALARANKHQSNAHFNNKHTWRWKFLIARMKKL